jgi:DNA invertase Pin-like site-specific DNA recombinase
MTKESQKRVAIYARVSTHDQNCEVQLEDLRRYADQRFVLYREYIDVGVSGAQRRRPQLDALMEDARKRLFDVVLVWKFDRFARSLKHLIDSLEEFRALGIDFISYTEGIDTTTPIGQLLFHIVGAMAQFERNLITDRVRAGIVQARRQGKHIGRPPLRQFTPEEMDEIRQARQGKRASIRQLALQYATTQWMVNRILASEPVASKNDNLLGR